MQKLFKMILCGFVVLSSLCFQVRGDQCEMKDIFPDNNNFSPHEFTDVNGTLFFSANGATNGYELWKIDSAPEGMSMVKDIRSGSNSSYPDYLTNVNGTLFFQATDGINGTELWKTDGTDEGTVMIKDINPGSNSSKPRNCFS